MIWDKMRGIGYMIGEKHAELSSPRLSVLSLGEAVVDDDGEEKR